MSEIDFWRKTHRHSSNQELVRELRALQKEEYAGGGRRTHHYVSIYSRLLNERKKAGKYHGSAHKSHRSHSLFNFGW